MRNFRDRATAGHDKPIQCVLTGVNHEHRHRFQILWGSDWLAAKLNQHFIDIGDFLTDTYIRPKRLGLNFDVINLDKLAGFEFDGSSVIGLQLFPACFIHVI